MFEKDFDNEIFVEPVSGGVRLTLPRRVLGKARHVGWVLLGMSLFGCAFMAVWMGFPISMGVQALREGEPFGWLPIGFGLLGLIGLLPALWGMLFGLTVLLDRTRCTVEVNRERLVVREKLIVGSWRQKRPLNQIERLRIGPALTRSRSTTRETGGDARSTAESVFSGKTYLAIHATGKGMKPLKVAGGYPRELLEKVAEELGPRIDAELELRELTAGGRDDSRQRAPLIVQDATAKTSRPKKGGVFSPDEEQHEHEYEVPEQPIESTATIERHQGGVVITCPPLGVLKGPKGLWIFALFWNGIVGLFLVMLTGTTLGMAEMEGDMPLWGAWLFMTPFVAIGVGIIATIFYIGTVRTSLATAGGRLLMARESCFGRKVKEWAAEDLKAIRLGASNTKANNRPVMELQIQPRQGNEFGFLCEREDEEIEWIAAELTRALELQKRVGPGGVPQAERDATGQLVAPRKTKLYVRPFGAGWQIEAPPAAKGTWLGMVIIGFIFTAIAAGATVVFAMNIGSGLFSFLFFLFWLTMFGGAGLGMLLGGLVALRRRYTVTVESVRLEVLRRGLFGSKLFAWPAEQVTGVKVADSGTRVNNVALKQIQIFAGEDEFKLMTGHSEDDLVYTAATLRETLGLSQPEYEGVAETAEVESLEPWSSDAQ